MIFNVVGVILRETNSYGSSNTNAVEYKDLYQ